LLVDKLDTSEDPFTFVNDAQHDQVIETQSSVVTQIWKEKKNYMFVDVYADSYMLTNNFISYMLIIQSFCFRLSGIHNHHVLLKEISDTCRKYLVAFVAIV
jgi:hypothetical protein